MCKRQIFTIQQTNSEHETFRNTEIIHKGTGAGGVVVRLGAGSRDRAAVAGVARAAARHAGARGVRRAWHRCMVRHKAYIHSTVTAAAGKIPEVITSACQHQRACLRVAIVADSRCTCIICITARSSQIAASVRIVAATLRF